VAVCRPIAERCAIVNRELFNIAFHILIYHQNQGSGTEPWNAFAHPPGFVPVALLCTESILSLVASWILYRGNKYDEMLLTSLWEVLSFLTGLVQHCLRVAAGLVIDSEFDWLVCGIQMSLNDGIYSWARNCNVHPRIKRLLMSKWSARWPWFFQWVLVRSLRPVRSQLRARQHILNLAAMV
jgi:hypothetical protein